MLRITIPEMEFWDERKEEFRYAKEQTLQLEHSLVSLSNGSPNSASPFSPSRKRRLRRPFTM